MGTPEIDKQMRKAFSLKGLPLWVPPSEVDSNLRYSNWSEQIIVELRDWFARKWSMAFAAGFLNLAPPKAIRPDVLRMLLKMGYSQERSSELADMLVDGLPGMYNKGLRQFIVDGMMRERRWRDLNPSNAVAILDQILAQHR